MGGVEAKTKFREQLESDPISRLVDMVKTELTKFSSSDETSRKLLCEMLFGVDKKQVTLANDAGITFINWTEEEIKNHPRFSKVILDWAVTSFTGKRGD